MSRMYLDSEKYQKYILGKDDRMPYVIVTQEFIDETLPIRNQFPNRWELRYFEMDKDQFVSLCLTLEHWKTGKKVVLSLKQILKQVDWKSKEKTYWKSLYKVISDPCVYFIDPPENGQIVHYVKSLKRAARSRGVPFV